MQISIIRENDSEGGNSVSCSFPQDVRVVDILATLKMAEMSIRDMLKEKGLPKGTEVKEWLENLKIEDLYNETLEFPKLEEDAAKKENS